MSRGLGVWQRAILDAVDECPDGFLLRHLWFEGEPMSVVQASARRQDASGARPMPDCAGVGGQRKGRADTSHVRPAARRAGSAVRRKDTWPTVSVVSGKIAQVQHLNVDSSLWLRIDRFGAAGHLLK